MGLNAGQVVIWERVSTTECRVLVQPQAKVKPDPVGALNFAKEHGLETMGTDEWMRMLREGEED
jgi:hypothetical protein